MIGYKTLKKDGTSLNSMFQYDLSGKWQTVPGNGSYVAKLGGGLFAGGYGEILVEIEGRVWNRDVNTPDGVRCYGRTRIRRLLPWTSIPPDQGKWRYWAACEVPGLPAEDRRELVMKIPVEQGEWRYFAALYVKGLTDEDRRELVMSIPPDQGEYRYLAARFVPGLPVEDQRELVMKIPVEYGKWRYRAALEVAGLSVEDRRKLVMQIPADQGEWRYFAACDVPGLADDDKRILKGESQ